MLDAKTSEVLAALFRCRLAKVMVIGMSVWLENISHSKIFFSEFDGV